MDPSFGKITEHSLADGATFSDRDDKYQLQRNLSDDLDIAPLFVMLNEGGVDDLFGSWHIEEAYAKNPDTAFNPDEYIHALFGFM